MLRRLTLLLLLLCTYARSPASAQVSKPPMSCPAVSDSAMTLHLPVTLTRQDEARLARFPRPDGDNGWGIHWAPVLFGQPDPVVDRLVDATVSLGVRWVKIMQPDQAKLEHPYLIRRLVEHGMMPVLRIYRSTNTPYQHIGELVSQSVPLGVHYFELYNEPNITGSPGGWPEDVLPDPVRLADLWLPAARAVIQAGGYPGTPALAPGGNYEDVCFLRVFLQHIIALGGRDVLSGSWVALHNYFLNHPPDYPNDPVNLYLQPLSPAEAGERKLGAQEVAAINQARAVDRLLRAQEGDAAPVTIQHDSNGFRKFEVYEATVLQVTGFGMPILSTEGGVMPDKQEDARYLRTTTADVAAWTAEAYTYMVEQAPAYYFAFTPWLLVNQAGGGTDGQWEGSAWFNGPSGQEMPVVAAVRDLPVRGEPRAHALFASVASPLISSAGPPALPEEPLAPTPELTPVPDASLQPKTIPGKVTFLSLPSSQSSAPITPRPASAHKEDPAWVIIWRDGEAINCISLLLSQSGPGLTSWRPPVDGRKWALEIRSQAGVSLGGLGDPTARGGPLPAICGAKTVQVVPTAAPTPAPQRDWDPRLDELNIKVAPANVPSGTRYWKIVSAHWEDKGEAQGRHHVYIRLLDEKGQNVDGVVIVSWPDGSVSIPTERKPEPDLYAEYWANFPMYGLLGSYNVRVAGNSETLCGVGMPQKQHVDYLVVFQLTTMP